MRNFISTMHITGVGIIVFLLFFTTLSMTKAHAQKSKYGSTEWRRNRILNEDSRYTIKSQNEGYRYEIYSGEMYGLGSTVMIFDKVGKKLGEWQGKKALGQWAISPNGNYCALQNSCDKSTIYIINNQAVQIAIIKKTGVFDWAPNDEELYIMNEDTIFVFSSKGQTLWQQNKAASFARFSEKGNIVALVKNDGTINIYTRKGALLYCVNIWGCEPELSPIIRVSENAEVALIYSRKSKELVVIDSTGKIKNRNILNYLPKDILLKGKGIELIKENGTTESIGE